MKVDALDGLEGVPRASATEHFGLKEADNAFGERVVVPVADAADRGLDPGLFEAFGVFDRDALNAPVAEMDQSLPMDRTPVVERLLKGIQHEASLHGA